MHQKSLNWLKRIKKLDPLNEDKDENPKKRVKFKDKSNKTNKGCIIWKDRMKNK